MLMRLHIITVLEYENGLVLYTMSIGGVLEKACILCEPFCCAGIIWLPSYFKNNRNQIIEGITLVGCGNDGCEQRAVFQSHIKRRRHGKLLSPSVAVLNLLVMPWGDTDQLMLDAQPEAVSLKYSGDSSGLWITRNKFSSQWVLAMDFK